MTDHIITDKSNNGFKNVLFLRSVETVQFGSGYINHSGSVEAMNHINTSLALSTNTTYRPRLKNLLSVTINYRESVLLQSKIQINMNTFTVFAIYSIICSVLLTARAQVQDPYRPEATLYEFTDANGLFLKLDSSSYYAELPGFDNKASSVCLVGTWLFYDSKNFNMDGNAGMEYIFKPTYGCSNFNGLAGAVSSAKFVGSATDYTRDSITFYENLFFQGAEEYTFTDLANLNLFGKHASLIVTGKSAWTLYDKPNYEGQKVCVFPPPSDDFTPSFVTDTEGMTIPVPHGTVASVRKECYV